MTFLFALLLAFPVPETPAIPCLALDELSWKPGEVRYRFDPARVEEFASTHELRLALRLPDDARVVLALRRMPVHCATDALWLDGRPAGVRLDEGVQLWSAVDAGLEAWFALSDAGLFGWIRHAGALDHVSSASGEVRVRSDAGSRALMLPDWCRTDTDSPSTSRGGGASPARRRTLRVEGAFETDHEFFALFGELKAARTYLTLLLGALQSRFLEQTLFLVEPTYVGIWTVPTDPWHPEDADDVGDLLTQFRLAWFNGRAPVTADFYSFLSAGGPLGGAAARVDALCLQNQAFCVTGMATGTTGFPLEPNTANYDFVIHTHEVGHLFGSIHSHEFCPPLDECARPRSQHGPCQDEESCIRDASLMSYCGQCPGGFKNFTTWFHPLEAELMRVRSEDRACLEVVVPR